MVITTLLTTLLSTFATSVPDLCDAVILDASGAPVTDSVGQTLSRYCQWAGPDVPVWDADVCCSIDDGAAACGTVRADGSCPSATKAHYCKHGDVDALGGVTCYQPFPSMCDAGFCIEAPDVPPTVQAMLFIACCEPGGSCHLVVNDAMIGACRGDFVGCGWGVSNPDGTVECYGDLSSSRCSNTRAAPVVQYLA